MYEMIEDGRIVNPFNSEERPTFLPGDKVRDKRDSWKRIWRIVSRVAFSGNDELITLREVDGTGEITVLASTLIPYLEMVAMSKRYVMEKSGSVSGGGNDLSGDILRLKKC